MPLKKPPRKAIDKSVDQEPGVSPPLNWTYIHYRPRPPKGLPTDSVALTSTYGDASATSIERSDLPRLDDGRWLVTSLVDFHCYEVGNAFVERNPERYRDLCVLSSTCWSTCSSSKGKYTDSTRIDPSASPLDYKCVAFPMNANNSHWVLGILTHASDLLVEHNPKGPVRTSFLVLNSIHGFNPPDLNKRYLDFIRLLSMGKAIRSGALSHVNLFKPKVSDQL